MLIPTAAAIFIIYYLLYCLGRPTWLWYLLVCILLLYPILCVIVVSQLPWFQVLLYCFGWCFGWFLGLLCVRGKNIIGRYFYQHHHQQRQHILYQDHYQHQVPPLSPSAHLRCWKVEQDGDDILHGVAVTDMPCVWRGCCCLLPHHGWKLTWCSCSSCFVCKCCWLLWSYSSSDTTWNVRYLLLSVIPRSVKGRHGGKGLNREQVDAVDDDKVLLKQTTIRVRL